ncbi:MAG: TetR/AcrR family transcriptional regulator [Pyrinomonadaceae bacterium]|nr:TetR/AcrR family transcriptional regulator [Pyrinomonadaceae bacterium]
MSRQSEKIKSESGPPDAVAGINGGVSSGGRMAGEARRRQIVNVALRLFSEHGFRGVTTKEIAQAAGVSEAIIFRHFATKEELYSAIIDYKACHGGMADFAHPVAEMINCAVADAVARGDDRAVFEGIAREMMEHHRQDPDFLRLLLYSALEGHQLAQMFWDRNVRQMYRFLGDYISQRQRDGVFRDINPVVAVRAFGGMVIHHSLTNTLWDKGRTLLDIPDEDAAREFTEILLKGINRNRRLPSPRALNGRELTKKTDDRDGQATGEVTGKVSHGVTGKSARHGLVNGVRGDIGKRVGKVAALPVSRAKKKR